MNTAIGASLNSTLDFNYNPIAFQGMLAQERTNEFAFPQKMLNFDKQLLSHYLNAETLKMELKKEKRMRNVLDRVTDFTIDVIRMVLMLLMSKWFWNGVFIVTNVTINIFISLLITVSAIFVNIILNVHRVLNEDFLDERPVCTCNETIMDNELNDVHETEGIETKTAEATALENEL